MSRPRESVLKRGVGAPAHVRYASSVPSSVPSPSSSAAPSSLLLMTDVSALASHCVSRVCTPRSERQVLELLNWARTEGRRVCVAGAAHTMGAHTIADDALLLQTKFLNRCTFDPSTNQVTAQAGCKWSTVIRTLNQYGRTPRTLQSYCSFTVGGSISANVHGITSDETLSESLVSFRLLLADGTILPAVTRDGPLGELFRATVGGYGMTGIILEATFTTEPNHPIQTEVIPITRDSASFIPIYQRLRKDSSIVTKIVRINISRLDQCTLYLFRKTSSDACASRLPFVPSDSMPLWKQLAYTLIFHRKAFQTLRFRIENFTQTPIDWSAQPDRNSMLFETAAPLARLFQPLAFSDGILAGDAGNGRIGAWQSDTFLLKEYFIPETQFEAWWAHMEKLVSNSESSLNSDGVHLLNITLRSVRQNEDSLLNYAPVRGPPREGVTTNGETTPTSKGAEPHYVAAVFYFRLPRCTTAERTLTALDRQLIDATLARDGLFYLPYRVSYTREQLYAAYPRLDEWLRAKTKFDPEGRFTSAWYEQIVGLARGAEAALALREPLPRAAAFAPAASSSTEGASRSYTFRERSFDLAPQIIAAFTSKLDRLGSQQFADNSDFAERLHAFVAFVLPVESSAERLKSILSRSSLYFSTRRGAVTTAHLDQAAYETLLAHFHGSAYSRLKSHIASLRILQQTRAQIGGELCELLHLLPDHGRSIRRIACVGDHGRYIGVLANTLPWIEEVHNIHDGDSHVMTRIESGLFMLPAMKRHIIDYDNVAASLGRSTIEPQQRFDLLTMAQGLHHLSPTNLDAFLRFVVSKLAPGGYLIIREHDASSAIVGRMADMAHIIFNASTGVTWPEEQKEVRNFQSCDTWKTMLESYGLEDMHLLNCQETDSTEDIMMLFRKKKTPELNGPPCRDFLKGMCTRSDQCRYHHYDAATLPPCRDFQRGRCERISDCKYAHDRNDQTAAQVMLAGGGYGGDATGVAHSSAASTTSTANHQHSTTNHQQLSPSPAASAAPAAAPAAAAATAVAPSSSGDAPVKERDPRNVLFMPAEFYVVDSIAHLRDFLAEEPWYRFPFMSELGNIWSLSLMSFRASYQSFGLRATLSNSIFASNLMACVFTSYVYLQVSIFAVLLRAILGSSYAASNVMRVSHRSGAGNPLQTTVVDRYQPFSDFLYTTANSNPSIIFTGINGTRCQELMVKVDWIDSSIDGGAPSLGVPMLHSISIAALISTMPAYTSAMYRVPLPQLADFLRAAAQHQARIKGGKPFVFDF